MPRTTPGSTSRGLPCGDTPPDIACPNRPDGRCRGASIPIEVLLISALGGYHFLGLVHDQPLSGSERAELHLRSRRAGTGLGPTVTFRVADLRIDL